MTDSQYPLESMLSGARGAGLLVGGYVAATVLGACLGAWSAGWDVYGPEACANAIIVSFCGLGTRAGLLCFLGFGVTTLSYFKFDSLKWECLNALALLSTIYVYVACGAGDAPHSQTIIVQVPGWRFPASLAGLAVVYAAGRTALLLASRGRWASRAGM